MQRGERASKTESGRPVVCISLRPTKIYREDRGERLVPDHGVGEGGRWGDITGQHSCEAMHQLCCGSYDCVPGPGERDDRLSSLRVVRKAGLAASPRT